MHEINNRGSRFCMFGPGSANDPKAPDYIVLLGQGVLMILKLPSIFLSFFFTEAPRLGGWFPDCGNRREFHYPVLLRRVICLDGRSFSRCGKVA